MAGTPDKQGLSEHAQILAILAGVLSSDQEASAFKALTERNDLFRATDYFRYYLFRVYAKMGRMDLFLKKMDFWRDHVKWGLRCPLEDDGIEAKSDCHAWAAHPLFFLHSAIAGVTPDEPWFRIRRRRGRGRGDAPRWRERRLSVEGQGDSTQARTADAHPFRWPLSVTF